MMMHAIKEYAIQTWLWLSWMGGWLRTWGGDRQGASHFVEIALVISVVALVAAATFATLGTNINERIVKAADCIKTPSKC